LQVFEKYDHCIAMDVNKKISDPISDLEEYFTEDQGDEIEIEYIEGDENTKPFIGMEFTSLRHNNFIIHMPVDLDLVFGEIPLTSQKLGFFLLD
jgi:hypothetical protein